MGKRVAVIGAGVSGLPTVKTALDYGLQPTCFEQRADIGITLTARPPTCSTGYYYYYIGGVWYRVDPEKEDVYTAAHTYKGLVMNTTKDFYVYSDFPHKEECPLLPSCEDMKAYLDDYADAFKLRPHIKLRTQVLEVKRGPNYDKDGQWEVITRPTATHEEPMSELFDAVILCTGYFSKELWPELPDREDFHGPITHSGQFYSCDPYDDKTVVIVGAGLSGCDLASLLAPRAKKVKMVTRHGTHVFPQWISPSKSWEWLEFDRALNELASPEAVLDAWDKAISAKFNFKTLGLEPEKPLFANAFAISADIDQWINSGKVQVIRGGVEGVRAGGLKLAGREEVVEADAIICATGYTLNVPFLHDPEILPEKLGDMDWWQYFYPVHQKHSTFFGVGLQYQTGPYPWVCETQARMACGVMNEELELPSKEEMLARIKREKEENIAFKGTFPGQVQPLFPLLPPQGGGPEMVEMMPFPYLMEVSKWLGCLPDIDAIARESATLAWKCQNGPLLPAAFRLVGPHAKFHQAKKTIMALKDPAH